jgi:hypothetical protein
MRLCNNSGTQFPSPFYFNELPKCTTTNILEVQIVNELLALYSSQLVGLSVDRYSEIHWLYETLVNLVSATGLTAL